MKLFTSKKKRDQEERDRLYKERFKKYEEEKRNTEPYRFSVNREVDGWRWEVLQLYVCRGGSTRYDPVQNAFGIEETKEEAIKKGGAKCLEYTQIKKWREEREIYSLRPPEETNV